MKGVLLLIAFGIGLFGLSGCYTIPRHYTYQEVIVYYPLPDNPLPSYYPDPPTSNPPVIYPSPNPPRDRQPEKPNDSYRERDPLQGGSDRNRGGIKTDPPVRNPVEKDRGQQ
ncbi:MAG: hypothetical protein HXY48_01245 [Ignavibacteriaceae bacterium]|nr:hypothetical protein [Ignavibacteriaceae bacterium]